MKIAAFAGWFGAYRGLAPNQILTAISASTPPSQPFPIEGEGLLAAARATRLNHLGVYAPDGQDQACVEPMTYAIDAHNRGTPGDRLGVVELAPGDTLAITVRLVPLIL